ncbi:MAG: 2-oxoglutarate dehydrogenase E1 component [Myxococcales bacterium]|nr:MAG: 2-oxoglutarate dehydrogenase E1 component [Myxococcales bacterium]
MDQEFGVNQSLVEELYQRFKENPESVDPVWRSYFTNGGSTQAINGTRYTASELPTAADKSKKSRKRIDSFPPNAELHFATELQGRVSAMMDAFRARGHRLAALDPLGLVPKHQSNLSLEHFGLDNVGLDTVFSVGGLMGKTKLPLGEILEHLKEIYCRSIGVEFKHIDEQEIRHWLQERMESTGNHIELSREEQILILSKLTDAESFEQFLHTNYIGAKRFSLEGAESVIPLLELMIQDSAKHGVNEIVIGMAHRGRLNVLANVMEKNLTEIFAAFEDEHPELHLGRGDVKYHLGYSSDRVLANGRKVHLSLAFNPSHLEWVNPVVEGRVRAKQDRRANGSRKDVLPLLIHGDAAFAGQGVVPETLNLSRLHGYDTGGTIHLVINNQIGFTTSPDDARSTAYATDITRMLRCPIFHVNGEDPEAVAQTVRLATDFRQRFSRDVVIDMYCYRRHGHNEGDEPRFTQPLMYKAVDNHASVRTHYVTQLVEHGKITEQEAEDIVSKRRSALEKALKETRSSVVIPPEYAGDGIWKGYKGGLDHTVEDVSTAVDKRKLRELATRLCTVPQNFNLNPKIKRVLDQRREQGTEKRPLDWGGAEALAFASLVEAGHRIRITGQDCRRGTFSHRHATLFDARSGQDYTPLQHLHPNQGPFEIYDSPLSEAGVLGFEYGYSLDCPDGMVLWEAQFGDFVNSAQVIIDQFISSSEDKWKRLSALVMLLPHGFEGQGPEHSSARLERFLVLCAEDNMQVVNLTSPAQLFHCLRRQVLRPYRKPLIVMTPKSLLRHPRATSTLEELSSGEFQRTTPDPEIKQQRARRVILCSGKIYYDLVQEREKQQIEDVAIVRLEQLYPLRREELNAVLAPYGKDIEIFWVQEEPRNMGSWYFMSTHLPVLLGRSAPIHCIARPSSASPATGSMASHRLEQQWLLDGAFSTDSRDIQPGFNSF